MLVNALAALGFVATATAAALPSSCNSYTSSALLALVNARGTGERQGESVGFRTMNAETLAKMKGGKIYNVVYPAGLDQNSASGTEDLLKHVRDTLTSNPSECFILEGYSQGASLVVDALPKLAGAEAAAVKGVFLIGDPRRKANQDCNIDSKGGTSNKDSNGFLVSRGTIPDNWVPKTLDVCAQGDGVCDDRIPGVITPPHTSYPSDATVQSIGEKFITKSLA
ncbi:hypothetical protein VHEMI06395 [[Torrubiella] hemipterigena]|uniref:Cutinase n=1 Tax=[Torrubiella] hemipterigena TaxID=1531966 RepID=A0A0A1TL18_9HYPO|nr:hypothetical protein VHEMI06395 [[Torrubiella] hemipterigena]